MSRLRPARHDLAGGHVLLRVLLFSLGLVLVFTLVANSLPQVEGEAPVEEVVDIGALGMDDFVGLGESVFHGKGTCTLCHNALGRAPDLLALNVVQTAAAHRADPRYGGAATDVAGYLRESLVDPDAYVVAGFGKKGSDDTVSPMPAADRPPIGLAAVEIDAVIAFLQAKDGNEVTVALPRDAPAVEAAAPAPGAAAQTAGEALGKFGCAACHTLPGSESPVGPPLVDVGARLGAEALRESIVAPDAAIAEGYVPGLMPRDFAERMTVRELELLVQFLLEQKG